MRASHALLGFSLIFLVCLIAGVYRYSHSPQPVTSVEATDVPYDRVHVDPPTPVEPTYAELRAKKIADNPDVLVLPVNDGFAHSSEYNKYQGAEGSYGYYSAYAISTDGAVTYQGVPVEGADTASFVVIRNYLTGSYEIEPRLLYAKDARRVYYEGRAVVGADPNTFMTLDNGSLHSYGADATHVYFHDTEIPDADVRAFKILWSYPKEGCLPGMYARDAAHVYFKSALVRDADVKTFAPLTWVEGQYGKDEKGFYKEDMFIGADPQPPILRCSYG